MLRGLTPGILVFCLGACGHLTQNRSPEPLSRHGNPPFYEVAGKRYHVLRNAQGFQQTGTASWYGPGFHGKRTASGERYDQNGFTADHPSLPLPTYVQVTNLSNGKKTVVRINDRGPFHDHRIIDLSYAAAKKLDIVRRGTTKVHIRALVSQQPTARLYVQAGAFKQAIQAGELQQRLNKQQGLGKVLVENNDGWYRVIIGPLAHSVDLRNAVSGLRQLGLDDWFFINRVKKSSP